MALISSSSVPSARLPECHPETTTAPYSASLAFSSAGSFGKLVAEFEADVADLGPSDQAGFQRRIATSCGQVVIRPGDRVDADADP